MVIDPAFWEKYGNVMVYSDHASAYDPVSGVWTLEGYDQIPKCPMTVTQVTANEFWTECPVTFPVPTEHSIWRYSASGIVRPLKPVCTMPLRSLK